jgi:hypothetical protein
MQPCVTIAQGSLTEPLSFAPGHDQTRVEGGPVANRLGGAVPGTTGGAR